MASKKRAVSNSLNKRKGELVNTNKKNVTNNNNLASITKQQRQRRESSRDQPQTTPSAVTVAQRRASMGQSRKKETTRATTENKRTPARRKVCNKRRLGIGCSFRPFFKRILWHSCAARRNSMTFLHYINTEAHFCTQLMQNFYEYLSE
jgi:hypothetical protein